MRSRWNLTSVRLNVRSRRAESCKAETALASHKKIRKKAKKQFRLCSPGTLRCKTPLLFDPLPIQNSYIHAECRMYLFLRGDTTVRSCRLSLCISAPQSRQGQHSLVSLMQHAGVVLGGSPVGPGCGPQSRNHPRSELPLPRFSPFASTFELTSAGLDMTCFCRVS